MSSHRRFEILLAVALLLGWGSAPPARAADIKYPVAVATDAQGVIYIADRNLPGVWQVKDGKRELYFEGSKKFRTPLNAVRCVAVDTQGRLLAGDSSTREIYRFDGEKKPQPLTKGGVGIPMVIALDKDGNLFIGDLETQRIFKQPAAGGELAEFATVAAPRGLAIDGEGRVWVVAYGGKDQVLRFAADGKSSEVIVSGRPFEFPNQITLDKDLNAYVADGYAKTIWKIGSDKKPVKYAAGEPFSNPVGLAWQGDKLLVIDPRSKDFLYSVEPDGKITPVPMAAK